MSVENVKKFYEAVSKDEALKQKFVQLSQKYQGQPMDEAKAASLMEQEALPLAKQLGYEFAIDDLKAYGEEMKRANTNCELSDSELEVVTGAGLICVYLGFNEADNGNYHECTNGKCIVLGFNTTGGFCCIVGAGTK